MMSKVKIIRNKGRFIVKVLKLSKKRYRKNSDNPKNINSKAIKPFLGIDGSAICKIKKILAPIKRETKAKRKYGI